MRYDRRLHAARSTDHYVFNQLIPYIGNKRKLLPLIGRAVTASGVAAGGSFLDLFAGSGVVARFAKTLGFRVIANDWEPYAEAINRCHVGGNAAPRFGARSYAEMLGQLNALPPTAGWVTDHLCPDDDEALEIGRDRMFYMRKNGMRIDAIREEIARLEASGAIDADQAACLIAPLLYQCCYTSNTSGVFKGFHAGWGGSNGTARYRICGDLMLEPALFLDNGQTNEVTRLDAHRFAAEHGQSYDFVYLDPPYNQHPYGSNYHVLNSVALWDKPELSPKISGRGDKSAIRHDWRSERRSPYNSARHAAAAFADLVGSLPARWIAVSYSTDGNIPLIDLARAAVARGATQAFIQPYKRYRVSSQRFSAKPLNAEFVLLIDTGRRATTSPEAICDAILAEERAALMRHPEMAVAP
ncbi:DNA adenine methylase [Rhizorhabdus dicambivorans]|uniref:site-specific DNA-methyltransferase (adenine-specific) n=1 Tax=Rhizorhabdus dicambivorans TaxID=1850238 RepID=A0A2A4FZP3_9SPHN|nr:DNA adenine methylase [Rhizorhabdus dicambivorans]ATE63038.1 DNA methyltransferase [Rhizorhabdus dicambivorans]PCE43215.1 DNA methyltransferase [Rhizorhabdus dicambivorans]